MCLPKRTPEIPLYFCCEIYAFLFRAKVDCNLETDAEVLCVNTDYENLGLSSFFLTRARVYINTENFNFSRLQRSVNSLASPSPTHVWGSPKRVQAASSMCKSSFSQPLSVPPALGSCWCLPKRGCTCVRATKAAYLLYA